MKDLFKIIIIGCILMYALIACAILGTSEIFKKVIDPAGLAVADALDSAGKAVVKAIKVFLAISLASLLGIIFAALIKGNSYDIFIPLITGIISLILMNRVLIQSVSILIAICCFSAIVFLLLSRVSAIEKRLKQDWW
ncbi:MAG: hypothetical protein PHU56_00990 [Candidatus Pacebacteria bacterium]|nr:hypothetical protein [Candidatus Paceibacterota bacterium]